MKEKIFKKGITRRFFSAVIALAMVLSLMPGINMTVYASDFCSADNIRGHYKYVGPASNDDYVTVDLYNASGALTASNYSTKKTNFAEGALDNVQADDWFYFDNSVSPAKYKKCDGVHTVAHTHSFSTDWTSDETNHWHACTANGATPACKNETGAAKAAHSGGTATCSAKAVCSICNAEYGDVGAEHTYATAWSYDEINHWHAATCSHTDEISSEAVHSSSTAAATFLTAKVCDDCGYVISPKKEYVDYTDLPVGTRVEKSTVVGSTKPFYMYYNASEGKCFFSTNDGEVSGFTCYKCTFNDEIYGTTMGMDYTIVRDPRLQEEPTTPCEEPKEEPAPEEPKKSSSSSSSEKVEEIVIEPVTVKLDIKTVNVEGVELNSWHAIETSLPTLTSDKLSQANGDTTNVLQVNISTKADKTVPASTVQTLAKSPASGMHVFIGNNDAVTFVKGVDYSKYTGVSFTHFDTITDNGRVIDFLSKASLNAPVMFHTVVPANKNIAVYKVVGGQEVLVTNAVSTELGRVCFVIDSTATYVLRY